MFTTTRLWNVFDGFEKPPESSCFLDEFTAAAAHRASKNAADQKIRERAMRAQAELNELFGKGPRPNEAATRMASRAPENPKIRAQAERAELLRDQQPRPTARKPFSAPVPRCWLSDKRNLVRPSSPITPVPEGLALFSLCPSVTPSRCSTTAGSSSSRSNRKRITLASSFNALKKQNFEIV